MAVKAGEAYIPVKADMSEFGRDVETGAKKGGALKKAAGLIGGAFAASAAKDFLGSAVAGARESQAIANQTAQVIKTTAGAANISAEAVGELSSALSAKTAVDDEVIQSGANLLLTFTNIKNAAGEGNDIFNQTVGLANDMSVAFGQDMKSSSIQLGKALNDPIKGVSALGKVGVSFTKQQKEQIKTLVESGDTLSAQKVILGELESQVGGSAAAQADGSKKMAVAWGNFQETIGALLIPVIDKLLGALTKIATWASENTPIVLGIAAVIGGALVAAFVAWAINATAAAAANIAAAASTVAGWVAAAASALLGAAQIALAWLIAIGPIAIVIAAIAGVVALIVIHFDTIKNAIGAAWEWVKDATSAAWEWVTSAVSSAVRWMVDVFMKWSLPGLIYTHWETIKRFFSNAWTAIKNTVSNGIDSVVSFFRGLPNRIGNAAGDVFGFIRDSFKNAINFVIRGWNGLQFRIPGFDPPGPGPKFAGFILGMPDIPYLASGVRNFQGGLAVVGEEGPELVSLRQGSNVHTARETRSMLSDGNAQRLVIDVTGGDDDLMRLVQKWVRTKHGGDVQAALGRA